MTHLMTHSDGHDLIKNRTLIKRHIGTMTPGPTAENLMGNQIDTQVLVTLRHLLGHLDQSGRPFGH